jgi:ABC-type lipoprotein export system ATPase subunit
VLTALRAAADRGAVVVLATHDPEAAAAADGELALDAGEATWVRALVPYANSIAVQSHRSRRFSKRSARARDRVP